MSGETTDRRRFLHALWLMSAAGVAQSVLPGCAGVAKRMPPSAALTASGSKGLLYLCLADTESSSVLRIMNWSDGSFEDHSVPLGYPHSLIQDPDDSKTLYAFEAYGSLAKFKLGGETLATIDHLTKVAMFDGHGVLSKAKNKLICTEYDHASQMTVVAIRDATTLQRLFVAPGECSLSHQIVNLPGTTIIACANLRGFGNGGGAITFYDYEAGVIRKRVSFDDPVVHITAISASEVLATSRKMTADPNHPIRVSTSGSSKQNLISIQANTQPEAGPVCYARLDGKKRVFWDESKKSMFNGSFGIAGVPNGEAFLSSHYQSGRVIFWKNGEIANVFDIPGAMNLIVSADGAEFMALGRSKAHVYSLETYAKIKTIEYEKPILLVGNFKGSYG